MKPTVPSRNIESSRHIVSYHLDARFRQDVVFRYLDPRTTDMVADLGCGTGYFTSLIHEKRACVFGIDIDLNALRVAKRFLPALDFVLADTARLPIKDQAVTKVLCTEVLEHIEDDIGVAKECFRILSGAGVFVCSSPNTSFFYFPSRPRKTPAHTKSGPERHVRPGYSSTTVRDLLSQAGFDLTDLSYTLPALGSLLVESLEVVYSLIYCPLVSQSELQRVERAGIFRLYKLLFPFLLRVAGVRFPRSSAGSILIAKAIRPGKS